MVAMGILKMESCDTSIMVADMFTKALGPAPFIFLRELLLNAWKQTGELPISFPRSSKQPGEFLDQTVSNIRKIRDR